ncbi:MAG: HIT family protein [Coprobacillus sp.]|nr:HIT family protein [Coprobacillus sp.]MDY4144726.1 HIT family protein [Bacilli bacterium]CCY07402.1 protein hit [Coprobacillus sp. CAG:698]
MCIFCNIISGEIPSYKVYEDDNFYAFLDISQATYGHTLVVPKQHFENLFAMPDFLLEKMLILVRDLASKIKTATNCKGINILNNNGEAAGQSVHHFHIHIIPRYDNDNFSIKAIENKLNNEEFKALLFKINSI